MQLITNQFSAEFGGHSAGVSSMITKSGTNAGDRLGVRDDPAGRLGRRAAAGADRQRREGQGAVQPAAVRRHRRRPDRSRTRPFFFGSYERRRERSQVVVTSPEANGLVVPTPADEHQGHAKLDLRFSDKNSLGVRYNMVRWKKDNESGGLQPAGHRVQLGQQRRHRARHVHDRRLAALPERGPRPVLALHRSPRRQVRVRVDRAHGYSTSGGNDQGTWGVLPEDDLRLSPTRVSLWSGNHTMKTGASLTYDVTKQLFAPLQNGVYRFSGSPTVAPNPFQYHAGVRARRPKRG